MRLTDVPDPAIETLVRAARQVALELATPSSRMQVESKLRWRVLLDPLANSVVPDDLRRPLIQTYFALQEAQYRTRRPKRELLENVWRAYPPLHNRQFWDLNLEGVRTLAPHLPESYVGALKAACVADLHGTWAQAFELARLMPTIAA